MDPFTEKLSDTPLDVVEDVIFEQYKEICRMDIYDFESSHFVCSMCHQWCPESGDWSNPSSELGQV